MIDLNTSPSGPEPPARAVVLLAKSAFAAAPMLEMQRLAQRIQRRRGSREHVAFAFSEQGTPALRDVILSLRDGGFDEIVVVPLLIPLEPSFQTWLGRTLQRWLREDPGGWPDIRISAPPEEAPGLDDLLRRHKRRVLVCQGGPCNAAGADVIWGHLRNEQERRKLRTLGDGVMTAKSTCLGPCNLAPVLQVFPEGTYYGGVTETGIDRIIDDHLLGGRVVAALAYEPTGRKQSLRHGSLPFKRQSS
jgi:(2Fe-2S) ferredoxin